MTKAVLIATWGLLAVGCYGAAIVHYSTLWAERLAAVLQ